MCIIVNVSLSLILERRRLSAFDFLDSFEGAQDNPDLVAQVIANRDLVIASSHFIYPCSIVEKLEVA